MRQNPGNKICCRSVDDIRIALDDARASRRSVVPQGAGFSQGAASNRDGIMLDLTFMNEVHIGELDGEVVADVKPGATVDTLWRTAMEKGYWPEFLPATPSATLGGCLAMNSSNANMEAGAIGEYVKGFALLLSSREQISVWPRSNDSLFRAVIGGMGMLGVVTRIFFKLRRIDSGLVEVRQEPIRSFDDVFGRLEELVPFEEMASSADYATVWINPYAEEGTERFGAILCGNYVNEDDPDSRSLDRQEILDSIPPLVRLQTWQRLLRPVLRTRFIRALLCKVYPFDNSSFTKRMPIALFHFSSPLGSLHHFLGNLMPQQCFFFRAVIDASKASAVASELLERSRNARLVPLWCSIKQHSSTSFVLASQIEQGYLLELAYYVTPCNKVAVKQLLRELAAVVIEAKGEISLDDSNALPAEIYVRSLGEARMSEFVNLRRKYDKDMLFQSDLCGGLRGP